MDHNKFKNIDTIIMDVDGVLTDGKLLITEAGEFLRSMNVRDGLALKLASAQGIKLAVITGGGSAGVKDRLKYLGVEYYYEKIWNKVEALDHMISKGEINPETTLYIGDDLADVSLAGKVHLLCCPADAIPEMIDKAEYICEKTGGNGCVREIVEKVMKSQGHWPEF